MRQIPRLAWIMASRFWSKKRTYSEITRILECGCRAKRMHVFHPVAHFPFLQSAGSVEAYDTVEVTANVSWPHARNPFTDAAFSGWFELADGSKRWQVDGFCDSDDGSVFRMRFMPSAPGDYRYSVEYRQGGGSSTSTGTFHATDGHRRGPIRVDPKYRWHFIWEGTGEHYFFNGTTAFWLMGWSDEKVIQASIARLHDLKINRMQGDDCGQDKCVLWRARHGGRQLDDLPYALAGPAG